MDRWMMDGWMDGWMEERNGEWEKMEDGSRTGGHDRWKNTGHVCFPKSQPHGPCPEFSQHTSVGFQEDTSIFWSIRP